MSMRRARIAVLLQAALWTLSCGEGAPEPGLDAATCLALVAFHRGVDAELTEFASEPGRVRIDFRSDGQDGVALCRVRALEDGSIDVTGALIDENRLQDDEIAAFRRSRQASGSTGSSRSSA